MSRYAVSVLLYSVGQPLAYLFAMGIGLAALINANGGSQYAGVGYLTFLAPALVASAALMSATGEFMFPIMDGFKWRRTFYGPHASPLNPEQIANGHIIGVTIRILLATAIYFVIVVLFGAAPGSVGVGLDFHRHPVRALLRPAADGLRLHHFARRRPICHCAALHCHPAVPVLRYLLSAGRAAGLPAVDRLALAALARHASSAGCSATATPSRSG